MVPFGLEKLGISQAMKEKSVDIALDVQSRTVFFQRAARRRPLHHLPVGEINTRTCGLPRHISSRWRILKGKRVGISDFNSIRHWAIQIQLKKAGLDLERDVEWVRIGVAHHLHKNAIRSGESRVRAATDLGCGGSQEGRVQRANVSPANQSGWGAGARSIAATGRILEEKPDLVKSFLKALIRILLVCARHAEELRVHR